MSFPCQIGPLPRYLVPSLGLSFPTLGRFDHGPGSLPASGLAPAAAALRQGGFVLSAQLLWLGHPGALPCFVSAAGPTTDTILAAAQWSRGGFLLPRNAGCFSRNQKGVQGPTGRTAQLAAGFSREPQKGGHAFCPAHCKGCFGHAVTRGVCARFPLSRADGFGERLIAGR